MNLGQFSISLTVKDIVKSKAFYEDLGFKTHEECGGIEEKWLILQKDTTVIGLFQDMFDKNIMTFNPENVREIQAHLQAKGHALDVLAEGDSGPAHCILKDPDGNTIMFDQHF